MYDLAGLVQSVFNRNFAEPQNAIWSQETQKIEYRLSTRYLDKDTYEHGDPRHYLAAMRNSLKPNSPVVQAFHKDLPRFTNVKDIEKNIEIERPQRAEYIDAYLTKISTRIGMDKMQLLPIVSHLSQGLMAEILEALKYNFGFRLPEVITVNDPDDANFALNLDKNSISLQHDIYLYNASGQGMDLTPEDLDCIYTKKEKHIKVSTVTTIDFQNLMNSPVVQTVTVEGLRDQHQFKITPLIEQFNSNNITLDDEYVMINNPLQTNVKNKLVSVLDNIETHLNNNDYKQFLSEQYAGNVPLEKINNNLTRAQRRLKKAETGLASMIVGSQEHKDLLCRVKTLQYRVDQLFVLFDQKKSYISKIINDCNKICKGVETHLNKQDYEYLLSDKYGGNARTDRVKNDLNSAKNKLGQSKNNLTKIMSQKPENLLLHSFGSLEERIDKLLLSFNSVTKKSATFKSLSL